METTIIKADSPALAIVAEAKAVRERDDLILRGSEIARVESDGDRDRATRWIRTAKTLAKDTEKERKAVGQPFRDALSSINEVAEEFLRPLSLESKRVESLVFDYQKEVDRKAREAEEARQAEVTRLEREKAEAERKAREAAESDGGDIDSMNAALAAEEAERKAREAFEAGARAPLVEPTRSSGMVEREVVRWEITDIREVFAARPHWFEIVPKRSIINGEVTPSTEIPGLRVWKEKALGFRS